MTLTHKLRHNYHFESGLSDTYQTIFDIILHNCLCQILDFSRNYKRFFIRNHTLKATFHSIGEAQQKNPPKFMGESGFYDTVFISLF